MDEVPIPGRDDSHGAFKEFLAMYGGPAFVRRARELEAAFEDLLHRCRAQREEWLPMVRLRLAMLKALAGGWSALRPVLASPEDLQLLERLHQQLNPSLRAPPESTSSPRRLRLALRELCESLALFNRRWQTFLGTLDLSRVNELRDGYNRYYLLEKECALRSARLAREGFRRLEPLTAAALLEALPLLPMPALPD